jgi:predicted site-specific integrase-resolvase
MDSDIMLTEKEAAKRLFAKPQTLNKWRVRGRGPVYLKLAGKVRYRLDDIKAFIEASRIDPAKRRRSRRRAR